MFRQTHIMLVIVLVLPSNPSPNHKYNIYILYIHIHTYIHIYILCVYHYQVIIRGILIDEHWRTFEEPASLQHVYKKLGEIHQKCRSNVDQM
jgi:hypothetical protein